MTNPKDVRQSPVLTNVSVGYKVDQFSYVADKLFPNVIVDKSTGKIVTYDADLFRIEKSLAAHNSASKEISISVSTGDHYDIETHRLKGFISNDEISEADQPIVPKTDTTEVLTGKLLTEYEYRVAQIATDSSIVTQNAALTSTARWNYEDTATPIQDIMAGKVAVRATTGYTPNIVIMPIEVFENFIVTDQVKSYFPGAAVITQSMIEDNAHRILGIGSIYISDAPLNTSIKGQADNLVQMWGKNVVLAYVETSPRKKSRSFGKTYRPRKKATRSVREWSNIDPEGVYVEVQDRFDPKIIDSNCAFLLQTVID